MTVSLESTKLEGEGLESKQHLINPENFVLLRATQQKIYEATQVTPSLRKILNNIISAQSLQAFSDKFIASLND